MPIAELTPHNRDPRQSARHLGGEGDDDQQAGQRDQDGRCGDRQNRRQADLRVVQIAVNSHIVRCDRERVARRTGQTRTHGGR